VHRAAAGKGGGGRKEESSFSVEKEAKRLSSICAVRNGSGPAQRGKSFLVLFFKKEHTFFLNAGSAASP
jgi:hypothetical protein